MLTEHADIGRFKSIDEEILRDLEYHDGYMIEAILRATEDKTWDQEEAEIVDLEDVELLDGE